MALIDSIYMGGKEQCMLSGDDSLYEGESNGEGTWWVSNKWLRK